MSPHKESEKNKRLKLLGLAQASVAHAIRNPLVAVGGFIRRALKKVTELSRESRQNPERTLKEVNEKINALKKCVKQSASDVIRMENLVTNVLSYIKPHEPQLKPNDLNKIAQSALEKKVTDIKRLNKKIDITLKKGKIPFLMTDKPQIELVILELIQNAVNAIADNRNRETITIRTSRDKNKVKLEIKNTGSVVPKYDREFIFTPLYTTGTGHGLGLAIAQAIVEAHGADISVKSKKNPPETAFVIKFKIPR